MGSLEIGPFLGNDGSYVAERTVSVRTCDVDPVHRKNWVNRDENSEKFPIPSREDDFQSDDGLSCR